MAKLARLAIIDPNAGRRAARASALSSTGRFKVVFESAGAKLQATDLLEITWDALLIEELLPETTPFALALELHEMATRTGASLGPLILTAVSLNGASRILGLESGFSGWFEVADGLENLIDSCNALVERRPTAFASRLIDEHIDLRADSVRAAADLALIETLDEVSRRVLELFAMRLSDKAISAKVSISQARVRQTIAECCLLLDLPTRDSLAWRLHLLAFAFTDA